METFLADEEDPSDPEWDEAALCLCMVGEPLLILGSVQEESYLYVRNECSEGWISAESVAVCRNRAEWLMAAFPIHPLVVTGDMVWLEASAVYPGTSAYRLRMGTVLELCVEEGIPEIKEQTVANAKKQAETELLQVKEEGETLKKKACGGLTYYGTEEYTFYDYRTIDDFL